MQAKERTTWIEMLHSDNQANQREAVYALANSQDEKAISAAVEVLKHSDIYPREVVNTAIEGLIAGAPATTNRVLALLAKEPGAASAFHCLDVLGGIARQSGEARDDRMVPAILKSLKVLLKDGTLYALSAVSALRECAQFGPIPEAQKLLWQVLETARKEENPYQLTIGEALEILHINEANTEEPLISRLRSEFARLPYEHGLANALRLFIAETWPTERL